MPNASISIDDPSGDKTADSNDHNGRVPWSGGVPSVLLGVSGLELGLWVFSVARLVEFGH